MEERNLTCIGCPLGCALKVTIDGENVTVTGNPASAEQTTEQRSDTSDTNCDKYSLCEKWHNTDGIRKDGTGYSKRKR